MPTKDITSPSEFRNEPVSCQLPMYGETPYQVYASPLGVPNKTPNGLAYLIEYHYFFSLKSVLSLTSITFSAFQNFNYLIM